MTQDELIAAVARMEELLAELRAVPAIAIIGGLELAAETPLLRPVIAERIGSRNETVRKMCTAVIRLQSTLGEIERRADGGRR